MTPPTATRRSAPMLALAALLLVLSACGGGGGSADQGPGPQQALATAKQKFDSTPSVRLHLSTDAEPQGNGIVAADGTLTDAPAFKGEVKVQLNGLGANVPVVSVGGKVYAKLPLTTGWSTIDPAQYGAPDPASFKSPSAGLSTLLTRMDDLAAAGQRRDGKLVLSTYTGTLSGDQVARILPSAAAGAHFDARVGIDRDGYLRTLSVTGPFFSGSDDVTYHVTLDDYGKSVTIRRP